MAKLPLDRYLQWGSGSGKSLTLNQVTSILLDVKLTGDWKYALRHVPRRKVVDTPVPPKKNKIWLPKNRIDLSNLSHNRKEKKRKLQVTSLYDE